MIVMTADCRKPAHPAIPATERRELASASSAPTGWKIWIGRFVRNAWPAYIAHHTLPVGDPKSMPRTPEGLPLPNTQATTFVCGELFVTTLSSAYPDTIKSWDFGKDAEFLLPIWPDVAEEPLQWPPTAMADGDADRIANAFFSKATGRLPLA